MTLQQKKYRKISGKTLSFLTNSDGTGVVISIAMVLCLVLFSLICIAFSLVSNNHITNSQVTDLVAISAASDLAQNANPNRACGVARELAKQNNSELLRCEIDKGDVYVRLSRNILQTPLGNKGQRGFLSIWQLGDNLLQITDEAIAGPSCKE